MMKHHFFILLTISMIIGLSSCQKEKEPFVFIVTADMRSAAMPEFRNSSYFQGACEAIKTAGRGMFMICPGDIDPPVYVREVIADILGTDYPWYPVVGNHELDAPEHMPYLRAYNKNGTSLPNIVRSGPPGSEETTYSFDWADNHFVVLNQYYDGKSDIGTDGDMVPELLAWLETDLKQNSKQNVFVFGHEPLIAIPDMDNGRLRHQDDSLNKYPKRSFKFSKTLKKYKVKAYICGHTHNTSIAKINDLWQIDVGHARGIEALFPALLWEKLDKELKTNTAPAQNVITDFYNENDSDIKRILYYTELTDGVSYKDLDDKAGFILFKQFYSQFSSDAMYRKRVSQRYQENANLARSTFFRFIVQGEEVGIEIYRDDARGGRYELTHLTVLD